MTSTLRASCFASFVAGISVTGFPAVRAAGQVQVSPNLAAFPVEPVLREVGEAGSVADFAHGLAAARIPAGVIMRKTDGQRTASAAIVARKGGRPGRLGDALTAFTSRHAGYSAWDDQGVLVVAPPSSPCVKAVSRRLSSLTLRGPVLTVAFTLFQQVNPSLKNLPPPGLVNAGGTPASPSLLTQTVSLYQTEISLGGALRELVRQVPGLVWGVVEDAPPGTKGVACIVNWFQADRAASTSYNILPGGG